MSHTHDAKQETLGPNEFRYTVLFEPAEKGGYVVHIPALGIATQGEDLEDARAMAKDAILCTLEGMEKAGEELPREGPNAVAEQVAVALSHS